MGLRLPSITIAMMVMAMMIICGCLGSTGHNSDIDNLKPEFNGSIFIKGDGDQQKVVHMDGGYIYKYKFLKNFTVTTALANRSGSSYAIMDPLKASKGPSGWYELSQAANWPIPFDIVYNITAYGPYAVEIVKLPLPISADKPNKTYEGRGSRAIGLIHLSRGYVTIEASGDAKYYPVRDAYPWDAGYTYALKNATTANWTSDKDLRLISHDQGVDETKSIYNSIVVYDVTVESDYIIEIMADDGDTRWKISVSQ